MSKPVSSLTAADFEPLNGENFTITAANGTLGVKLAEVRRLGTALREGGAFSLVFASAAGPILAQGTYPLTHPSLGMAELFVVPLGPKGGENLYQVIFT